MFEFAAGSLYVDVGARVFGSQHLGVSPGGASDQLSFFVAMTLLGDPASFRCAEIVAAASVTFTQPVMFVVTGAHHERPVLNDTPVPLHTVCRADAGDTLALGRRTLGFRTYLAATASCPVNGSRIGKSRGDYTERFGTLPARIRVTEGPEYGLLEKPERFLEQTWHISHASDRMGLRLEGSPLSAERYDIVSSAVDDGTVQLTASGPIVLMRARQTTGGYPRVFQVVRPDIDLLAQYVPGSMVHFEKVSHDAAKALLHDRMERMAAFEAAVR